MRGLNQKYRCAARAPPVNKIIRNALLLGATPSRIQDFVPASTVPATPVSASDISLVITVGVFQVLREAIAEARTISEAPGAAFK